MEGALQAPCGTAFDHLGKCIAQRGGNFRGHHSFGAVGVAFDPRLVGGVGGKVQFVDAQYRLANAVVLDDAHQLGQRCRPVTGTAQGSGQ